jgi:pilus retraction protein PilT
MTRFQNIISNAIKEAVSDIYLIGGHPMVSRKRGIIQFYMEIKWSHKEIDDLVRKLLNDRQLDALRQRKSLDFAMSASNARLRINVFTTARGLSLAIRILPGHIPTIDELNLHPSLHEISKIESGLVLTCGATGVGKTATVAAIINDINRTRQAHIITLENPIEFRFQSNKSLIQQRELDTHMPSFAHGLLDALRENPDVVVVGEMRERETMHLTLNAAEAGQLVIATMHASSPEEAIHRLCNSVPISAQDEIRYQIASTLKWLIIQQLVYMKNIGFRVPLLTIVRGNQSIRSIIRENKLHQINSVIQMGKNDGMFTAERYLSDYLENCQTFTPYEKTFRPSAETTQDIVYQSPLMEEKPEITPLKKRHASGAEMGPIIVRNQLSNDEMELMLTIDEDASLQELVSKLDIREN